ncbi:MAG: recombination mediator RecR [Gammaproteobacteria bacterium]|jgi:recombination protein RecR|nr:recombination mediator RecR [Gammaproteobacteria bacterium]MDH3756552.1 recombination mediator RecR [Gammaproteobacteria bacterium]MDH3846849.1 recombination mediator RecR [Gammaproteobacteria bacterium]MDH3863331.1 recombination mediator RecR [Gammaproteobacteria bacterium]MDH3905632.1 recombination mediator RecR [Gammaproteobacteria bacterium]
MSFSPLLVQLIDALRCMPGVGKKSAQRIAFHLLERDRDGASLLSTALSQAVQGIGHCKRCRMLSEYELCSICSASGRDETQLCIVESPADVMAIEDATGFRGQYFVLMGHLSPLDGIGPQELGLTTLEQRLAEGSIGEMIIATNPTVEGDATAHYLADLAERHNVQASRIAHGVPLGGELEYVDGGTLSHAFYGRRLVE